MKKKRFATGLLGLFLVTTFLTPLSSAAQGNQESTLSGLWDSIVSIAQNQADMLQASIGQIAGEEESEEKRQRINDAKDQVGDLQSVTNSLIQTQQNSGNLIQQNQEESEDRSGSENEQEGQSQSQNEINQQQKIKDIELKIEELIARLQHLPNQEKDEFRVALENVMAGISHIPEESFFEEGDFILGDGDECVIKVDGICIKDVEELEDNDNWDMRFCVEGAPYTILNRCYLVKTECDDNGNCETIIKDDGLINGLVFHLRCTFSENGEMSCKWVNVKNYEGAWRYMQREYSSGAEGWYFCVDVETEDGTDTHCFGVYWNDPTDSESPWCPFYPIFPNLPDEVPACSGGGVS